jgi:CCR4-NOT transcription complex subunit 7/8
MMLEVEKNVGIMPSGETLRVREVWHNNLDSEMCIIESIVEDYPYLAMDTEFPGACSRSSTHSHVT